MRTKAVGRRTAHSVDLRGGGGDRRRPVVEHGKLGAVGRKVVVCTPRRRIRTKPSTRVVLLGVVILTDSDVRSAAVVHEDLRDRAVDELQ